MRAATVVDARVAVRDQPDPEPGHGQILVGVGAAGLNGADLAQVAGFYPPPPGYPPDILGMEFAGEVVATGPGVQRWTPGDRVMAVIGGGAQAELAVAHEREAMPVPDGLAMEHAGGLPEVFLTAHDALFTQAGLALGERLCVHGAAGGVGTAAIQLGAAAGARVTATVRNVAQRSQVAALEPTVTVIDPAETRDHGPYDVILELVGAPNLETNLASLATGGRVVIIGVGAGSRAELDLRSLMATRGSLRGSTFRARPLEAKADAARRLENHVLPLFAAGRLRVPVEAAFGLDDASAAYERFAAGGKFGKIVLSV